MKFSIELFSIDIEKYGRSYVSLFEINKKEPLLYIEWGQVGYIQYSFLFGLIKKY